MKSQRKKWKKGTTKLLENNSPNVISTSIPINNFLNVNGLNFPIERHRVVELIKKKRLDYMLPITESFQL